MKRFLLLLLGGAPLFAAAWPQTLPALHLRFNTSELSEHHAKLVRRALQAWAAVLPLAWEPAVAHGDRTITFAFATGRRLGCGDFDESRDVAHTWLPQSDLPCRGMVHFNSEYPWDDDRDFYSVALHEIGHALGLGHSMDRKSVMYYVENRATRLTKSDREALRRLYANRR